MVTLVPQRRINATSMAWKEGHGVAYKDWIFARMICLTMMMIGKWQELERALHKQVNN
jgi:hypothetical protein